MYTKEMERLARTMGGQRLDYDYIRHYLVETYQLSDQVVEEVLEKAGIHRKGKRPGTGAMPSAKDGGKGSKRQGFF
jgi:hypothetical protein